MKKITILALHLGYGGIEKYISTLCKMLENDFVIEIISTYKVLEKPAFDFSDKIKITYLIDDRPYKEEMKQAINNKRLFIFFKYFLKNLKILNLKNKRNINSIKKIDSDIIITTRTFHNRLVSKYAKKNILKIATEHNYHNNDSKYINHLIESLNDFNYFIVVSKELQEFYTDKIGTTKCIYIPNVIENIFNNPKYNVNHNLISIGRLESEKGFSDLIDTINIIKKDIPNIKLDLIGDGSLKKDLQKQITEFSLNNNIIMHGYLNQEEIKKVITNSSLYVMTSHTESFGLVLIEAMSYGLPCVAFDSSSGARQVINDKNLLVENRNKQKLAKLIIKILNNPKLCKQIGEYNYKDCQKYLIDNVKEEWINLLK